MSKARIIEAVQNLDLETTEKLLDGNPSLLIVMDRLDIAAASSASVSRSAHRQSIY